MESFGLQSGFVLAAVLGAVLFAGRLGGGEEVARRVFQVALGVLIAFLAISATTAFFRAPESPPTPFEENFDEQNEYFKDVTNRNHAAATTHAGAGIVALLAGLICLQRFRTLALGAALGGLLLILFGGATGGEFSSAYGPASRGLAIAHFVLMLGGTSALLLFGYTQFEKPDAGAAAESTSEI